jgi:hypothetical protein
MDIKTLLATLKIYGKKMKMHKDDQNPMSLENLPDYLNSMKQNGNMENSCVVEMGTIIETRKDGFFSRWSQQIIFATAACGLVAISGFLSYNSMSNQKITVVLDMNKTNDPNITIPQIVNDSGAEVISVNQKNDSVYEVKISTKKSKKYLLEFLNKNKNVKNVEINE